MTDDAGSPPSGPIDLADDEAEAVTEAATAFAGALPADRAEPFRALAVEASSGRVPGERVGDLERVCVLALETGKARQLGRAEAERLLTAVYRRTPGGAALQGEVADVNRALAQLAGRQLESARLTWRMPGRYGLNLSVTGFDLTLDVGPEGLRVQAVQAG